MLVGHMLFGSKMTTLLFDILKRSGVPLEMTIKLYTASQIPRIFLISSD